MHYIKTYKHIVSEQVFLTKKVQNIWKNKKRLKVVRKMKGLILNKGENSYSYFKDIFWKINEISEDYNWLISYPECYPQNKELREKMDKDYIWLSGQELKNILYLDNFQWIWGVLSGFPKCILLEDILRYPLPYADGYMGFWRNPITLQHPLADIELVAWDNSCTLFISKEESLIEKIIKIYQQAEDLENYNEIPDYLTKEIL